MPILPLTMEPSRRFTTPNTPPVRPPFAILPRVNLSPIRAPGIPTSGFGPSFRSGLPNDPSITGRPFNAPREATQQIQERGGPQLFNNYGGPQTPTSPATLPPSPDTDYQDLMNYYRSLLNRAPSVGGGGRTIPGAPQTFTPETTTFNETYTPITPVSQEFIDDPEFAGALKRLGMLAETGGYSEEDIGNIRARGVSPIRSIYANAMMELNRQRALQGGYSPNFAAAAEKMARTESDRVGNQLVNINADIAEKVASGKRSLAPIYASEAAKRLEAKNAIAAANAAAINRANEFNRTQQMSLGERRAASERANVEARNRAAEMNLASRRDYENMLQRGEETENENQMRQFENQMRLVDAMRQLYGTTPARSELAGRQSIANQEQARLWQQLNQQGGQSLVDAYLRARGGR